MPTSAMRSANRLRPFGAWCLLVALGLVPGSVEAQESREALIAAAQAEKAAKVTPYEPGGAEKLLVKLKKEFLEEPSGFYPVFASVYSGGGFTLGAGYRQFYGDRTFWDLKRSLLPHQLQAGGAQHGFAGTRRRAPRPACQGRLA